MEKVKSGTASYPCSVRVAVPQKGLVEPGLEVVPCLVATGMDGSPAGKGPYKQHGEVFIQWQGPREKAFAAQSGWPALHLTQSRQQWGLTMGPTQGSPRGLLGLMPEKSLACPSQRLGLHGLRLVVRIRPLSQIFSPPPLQAGPPTDLSSLCPPHALFCSLPPSPSPILAKPGSTGVAYLRGSRTPNTNPAPSLWVQTCLTAHL